VYSSVKQTVGSVHFCQANCGQCTVLSSKQLTVYSSVKQTFGSVQFCQANCSQCTVLSSKRGFNVIYRTEKKLSEGSYFLGRGHNIMVKLRTYFLAC
jgi:hypothetical protein